MIIGDRIGILNSLKSASLKRVKMAKNFFPNFFIYQGRSIFCNSLVNTKTILCKKRDFLEEIETNSEIPAFRRN